LFYPTTHVDDLPRGRPKKLKIIPGWKFLYSKCGDFTQKKMKP
jgi:hypothetical protein